MTVEEVEKHGGCLVRVKTGNYWFGGNVYILFRIYREKGRDGEEKRGCLLKNPFNDREFVDVNLDAGAESLELIPFAYLPEKYEKQESELPPTEIYGLLGKLVEYEGRPVFLRRLGKEYDGNIYWNYMLSLQEYEAPYTVFDAEISKIRRYNGKQPEFIKKVPPPIVQRKLDKAVETDRIKAIQEETLAALKAAAV